MFEERDTELERQTKHESETAGTAQKPNMIESSTLEQAEGGFVSEVSAAHHLKNVTNAEAAEMEQAEGRLVAGSRSNTQKW